MPKFNPGVVEDVADFLAEDTYLRDFQIAYMASALWTGAQVEDEDADAKNDGTYGDLSADAITKLCEQAEEFVRANVGLLIRHAIVTATTYPADYSSDVTGYAERAAGQAGHDFWLTRNGHGAGFWDRGLGGLGDQLTEACRPYGEVSLWVAEDDAIEVD